MTASAGPSADMAEYGSRFPAAAAPSLPDMPPTSDLSYITVTLPSAGEWIS